MAAHPKERMKNSFREAQGALVSGAPGAESETISMQADGPEHGVTLLTDWTVRAVLRLHSGAIHSRLLFPF